MFEYAGGPGFSQIEYLYGFMHVTSFIVNHTFLQSVTDTKDFV